MKIILSEAFAPLLDERSRYLVLSGGAGSGKSEFSGRKLYYRCETEGAHRFLIMRKVRKTLADSVILVMRTILADNGIAYEYNKSDRTITFLTVNGSLCTFLFEGMDDPEKIKSIKGISGIWLEEATEFSRDEFMQIDLRLREPGPGYHQIIMSFNPDEAAGPWIKEMFFDRSDPSAFVHTSTVDDNPIKELRDAYRTRLDGLREKDEPFWKIYRLGLWAAQRGRIFDWPAAPLPQIKFDEIWYGADFGYSVDPAAVVRIYRKADEYWVEQLIYAKGLTNQALAARMTDAEIGRGEFIYFDSAEPKSIEEIRAAGFFNALPSDKGPDSVRAGIDYLKSCKIRIVEGSIDLINEANHYHWREDRAGRALNEPVKYDDHLMDAIRYGIMTHMKAAGGGYLGVLDHDIRPD